MSQTLTPISAPSIPHALLDKLLIIGELKNDAALAKLLDVAPPVISKIRHRTLPVGPAITIRIHKAYGLSILDIEALAEQASGAQVAA
jgi:plasmid maintenance system antidote protein VapI